ncbi:MAG: NAD kinase [Rickettsiaceae bacterium]|nr:NAD kinase [Rickettsiaceae bacterium]
MTNHPKFLLISSDTPNAYKLKAEIEQECNLSQIALATNEDDQGIIGIIVIGGDGFMLKSLHNLHNLKVPFIGINAGQIGFLMNSSFDISLLSNINELPRVRLNALEVRAINQQNQEWTNYAFNEISIYRSTNQAAKLSIEVNSYMQMEELISDGLIVSTPAGSSAYNLSAGGRIIPIDSNLICITPVCPFRPRRWHGAIIPESCLIKVKSLESKKRPVNVVADFNETRDILSIEIRQNSSISAELVFASDGEMDEKMIREQFII